MNLGTPDSFDLADQSAYIRYAANQEHKYDPGVFVLPVASETSSAVVVRCHGGVGSRVVTFDLKKQGNPPVAPAPSLTIGTERLVAASVSVPTPSPNPQIGSYDWNLRGTYVYYDTSDPRIPGRDQLPAVSFPFVNPAQDSLAAQSLQGRETETFENEMISAGVLQGGGLLWPITVYPSKMMMNPLTLGY